MKKIFLIIIFLVLSATLVTRLGYLQKGPIIQSSNVLHPSSSIYQTPIPKPANYSEPLTLLVPKLNINSQIEEVGQDQVGRMDVPKNFMNVGWYKLGFKPGEKGSAVIAGHFDTVSGTPAVFYNLGNLTTGDDLYITNKAKERLHFKVTKTEVFDFDKVPLQEVFASTDTVRLNLITCNGTFNQNAKNYTKRLVVYTKLVP
jgi:sortase A